MLRCERERARPHTHCTIRNLYVFIDSFNFLILASLSLSLSTGNFKRTRLAASSQECLTISKVSTECKFLSLPPSHLCFAHFRYFKAHSIISNLCFPPLCLFFLLLCYFGPA